MSRKRFVYLSCATTFALLGIGTDVAAFQRSIQQADNRPPLEDRDAPGDSQIAIEVASIDMPIAQAETRPPLDDRDSPGGSQGGGVQFNFRPADPLDDRGSPGGIWGGGGRRYSCPVPASLQEGQLQVWGLTLEERPNLWFYVPYSPEDIERQEFVVRDETGRAIYQKRNIDFTDVPGLVNIELPVSLPSDSSPHRWELKLEVGCRSQEAVQPIWVGVSGWVRRVDRPELEVTDDREAIAQLAEAGIWYDAFDRMARLRQNNPNDPEIEAAWNKALENVEQALDAELQLKLDDLPPEYHEPLRQQVEQLKSEIRSAGFSECCVLPEPQQQ